MDASMTCLIALFIVFLLHKGSAPTANRKEVELNRSACLREILSSFWGPTGYDDAKEAMENYTLESLTGSALVYYRMFGLYILPGRMNSYTSFCAAENEPEYCETIIHDTFSKNTIHALHYAFFKTNLKSMEQFVDTRKEPLWRYFKTLLNRFRLDTSLYRTPVELCKKIFQYPNNEESEEVGNGENEVNESSEGNENPSMDSEGRQQLQMFSMDIPTLR